MGNDMVQKLQLLLVCAGQIFQMIDHCIGVDLGNLPGKRCLSLRCLRRVNDQLEGSVLSDGTHLLKG